MTTASAGNPGRPTPAQLLRQMMAGYLIPQVLYAAARLNLADALAGGPRDIADLAAACDADPDALRRLLRALAALSVVSFTDDGRVALAALGEGLRSAVPGTARSSVLAAGAEMYRAWGAFLHSVRTGAPAFDHVFGAGWYDYLDANPDTAAAFDRSMQETDDQGIAAVATAYDFSAAGTVVDVGGGQGALLIAVLHAWPGVRGVLFDRPAVIAGAEPALAAAGLDGRCRPIGGDFFAAVPSGGDIYILARTLLNWDRSRSRAILRACAAAMPADSRLLVVEPLLPEHDVALGDALNDLHLLVMGGGRMCTRSEFARLFSDAGLSLTRVIPTGARLSILEAVRA